MGTLIETLTNLLEEWKEFRKERAQRIREEGGMEKVEGGREETDVRKGKGKDDGAWRDVLRGFGMRHRGGGREKMRDESKEKHIAWRERFRRRGRRGADVEIGVDGRGEMEELKES